jgi:hypothetical protein
MFNIEITETCVIEVIAGNEWKGTGHMHGCHEPYVVHGEKKTMENDNHIFTNDFLKLSRKLSHRGVR